MPSVLLKTCPSCTIWMNDLITTGKDPQYLLRFSQLYVMQYLFPLNQKSDHTLTILPQLYQSLPYPGSSPNYSDVATPVFLWHSIAKCPSCFLSDCQFVDGFRLPQLWRVIVLRQPPKDFKTGGTSKASWLVNAFAWDGLQIYPGTNLPSLSSFGFWLSKFS